MTVTAKCPRCKKEVQIETAEVKETGRADKKIVVKGSCECGWSIK